MQIYASKKTPKAYWELSEAGLSLRSNQAHQRLP